MPIIKSILAREKFGEIVSGPDDRINLAEAALLIAAEEYGRLDIGCYLERLDHLGDLAREKAATARNPLDFISAINETLYDVVGFRGNRKNYYDPRNSFLNEVIDRHTGIPITLSVVYIEVGQRIGFPLNGVGLPFHFIVKQEAEYGDIFIDAFNDGRVLGPAECEAVVTEMSGGKLALQPDHLASVTRKQILFRMLSNLAGIYSVSDPSRALAAIERILLIDATSANHVRDRGLLLARVGDPKNAIAELERYLIMNPNANDSDMIRGQIKSIHQDHAKWN